VSAVERLDAPPAAESAAVHYVEVDALSKIYNPGPRQVEALGSVSFSVRSGDFVSILGPSGCGKSTLLMIVGGLEPATTGSVRVAGEAVSGPRLRTGVIFQDPTLLPWKTVLENVLFPVQIQRRMTPEFRARADELLRLVGLQDFEHKRPHELSGGMKQRAAICRALVTDPDLMLMDEPFSALDAITRDELNVALLDIWERHHKTGLFVTHSIREAVFLSDRVIVMGRRPSRIVADVPVPFPRPRDIRIQESSAFTEICAMLRDKIGSHHG
jgi:NitT/TauT family transport system ATP-binding protein